MNIEFKTDDSGNLIIPIQFFNELIDEYSKLSEQNGDISTDDETGTIESGIFGRKHTYCVTTGDGSKHQFREYPALAHAKCIQLGMTYGTPASLSRGECKSDDNSPL